MILSKAKARVYGLFTLIVLLYLLGLAPKAMAQAVNLQGPYTGTRTETGSTGSLPATSVQTIILYQTTPGGAVVGTINNYWPTTSYYWSGAVTGTISGTSLTITFTPEVVNLPAGNTACGETETLPISTVGTTTTLAMPSYHPCGSMSSTLLAYNLVGTGWQHLGCSPCGPQLTLIPRTGIPIDPTTGNVTDTETDYTTSGMNQLAFSRYYNAFNPPATFAGTMGTQWRTNYDRYLQVPASGTTVIAERPGGDQITFTLVGSVWTPPLDVDMTLTNSGATWTLTGHDDSVETYTVSGTKGTLNSIALRNGYTQTLTYTSGLLTSVSDSYSRTLGLSYTSGLLTGVTTPDSLALTYGYNVGGTLLTSVGYNTSPATSETYNYTNASFPNALTSITDELGNTWKNFSYDTYGRSTSAMLTGTSTATQMTYTDATAARVWINALGVTHNVLTGFTGGSGYTRIVGMKRNAGGGVLGATSAYGYDTSGFTNSFTDYNGNITTYTNNAHGDPTSITEASGTAIARTTTIAYDTSWVHLPATITTPGVTVSFTYDGSGNTLTVTLTDTTSQTVPYPTNGQTHTWTYTYDTTGHVLTAKTPNLNSTTFTYDASGRLTSATNALSQAVNVTSLTAGGLPLTVADANGVTSVFTYSPRNWLLTKDVDSTGGAFTTTTTYDAAGNITKNQQPDGSYFVNGYDNSHRLTSKTDSFGNSVTYTLDALGDATATTIKNPSSVTTRATSATFDSLGRQLSYKGGVLQQPSWTYDGNSNVTSYLNPVNDTFTYTLDALNRVSKNALPISAANINYTYDAHDRPLTVQDPIGNTTSYVYDGFGNVIQRTSPDTGTTVYHYDSDDNLTQKVDGLSITTNYSYDALDRMLTTSYPAHTSENVAYTYDQTGTGFANGVGRLTSLTDGGGSLTRTYDTRGNLATETRTSGLTVLATTYTYDAASRVATITYPDGSLVTYTRDAMGKVTAVSDKPSGAGSPTTIASSIAYAPFGPVSGLTYGNSVTYVPTLDADYRLTALVENGTGTTHIQNFSNGLKFSGQPTNYNDNLNSTNNIASITYDGMSQMNEFFASSGGGTNFPTYDKNSNRTAYYAKTYTYNTGTNQLKTIVNGASTTTVTTNANGNITAFSPAFGTAGVTGLGYNNANELASVSGSSGTLGSYVYDARGDRFSKTVGAATTIFQYAQGGLLAEVSGTTETNYIYLHGRPVATLTGSSFTWLHTDRLGVPQVATNSSQAVTGHWNYLPFGEPNGSGGTFTQNLRFPGQYFDAESGFNHNGARDYSPSLGRYLEADPAGVYDLGIGAGINPYGYAGQDPMFKTDPMGLSYGNANSSMGQSDMGAGMALTSTGTRCWTAGYSGHGVWIFKRSLDGSHHPVKSAAGMTIGLDVPCPDETMVAQLEETESDAEKDETDLQNEVNQCRFNNALDTLRQIDPDNRQLVFYTSTNWTPSEKDIEDVENEIQAVRTSESEEQSCTLRRVHPDSSLVGTESYKYWSNQSTESILESLEPGQDEPLTVDPSGLIWQGNTRTLILEQRGVPTSDLPRLPKEWYFP